MPLLSNKEIHEPDPNIDRAVIVIHGMNRNAEDYYNSIYDNAMEFNTVSETIIIAPQFLITLDLNHWQPINEYVFWSAQLLGLVEVGQTQLICIREIFMTSVLSH